VGRQKSTSSLDRSTVVCNLIWSSPISSYSLATLVELPLYCFLLIEPGEVQLWDEFSHKACSSAFPIPNPRAAFRISWIPWSAQHSSSPHSCQAVRCISHRLFRSRPEEFSTIRPNAARSGTTQSLRRGLLIGRLRRILWIDKEASDECHVSKYGPIYA